MSDVRMSSKRILSRMLFFDIDQNRSTIRSRHELRNSNGSYASPALYTIDDTCAIVVCFTCSTRVFVQLLIDF
jgi:hypothetical protein